LFLAPIFIDKNKGYIWRSSDMTDELKNEKNKGRIAQWEARGVDVIKADLVHTNGRRYVGKHKELAWDWVRQQEKQTTLVKLLSNSWVVGIGVGVIVGIIMLFVS
jgi:hypothetical protein